MTCSDGCGRLLVEGFYLRAGIGLPILFLVFVPSFSAYKESAWTVHSAQSTSRFQSRRSIDLTRFYKVKYPRASNSPARSPIYFASFDRARPTRLESSQPRKSFRSLPGL